MKTNSRRSLLVLTMAGLAALISGCSTVKVQPWERAKLAEYSMRADRDPLAVVGADHTYFSRESATGGRGVGGSGCGCN